MPWLETDPVTERKRFIMEWLSGEFAVAELCRPHEISRKTGYKWIARYERERQSGSATADVRSSVPEKFAPGSSGSIPIRTFLANGRCTATSCVEDW